MCIFFGSKTQAYAADFESVTIPTVSDGSEIEKLDAMYVQKCSLTGKEVKEELLSVHVNEGFLDLPERILQPVRL
jgi:hypothetical protein